MTRDPSAIRAKKARRSAAVSCGCFIRPGTVIIRQPDGKWVCREHALAAVTNATKEN